MKNKTTVQEMAMFLRDAAYADDLNHGIDWSLRIIHPSTNDGVVGYGGGIWERNLDEFTLSRREQIMPYRNDNNTISISFSFDEINGIYNFSMYKGRNEIRIDSIGSNPSFETFKNSIIKYFSIKKLYEIPCKSNNVAYKYMK